MEIEQPITVTELQTVQKLSQSTNGLITPFYGVVEKGSVFSPVSIAAVLSLLHLGSTGNTEKQLTDLMHTKFSVDELRSLSRFFNSDFVKLTNAIVVNGAKPVEPSYLAMVEDLALVSNDDFGSPVTVAKNVNTFIEKNTNGLIKDILQPEMLTTDTLMVLINTLYFKIQWSSAFKPSLTKEMPFNGTQAAPMMMQTSRFNLFENSEVQILEMPYKGKEFCMGFVLPTEGSDFAVSMKYVGSDVSFDNTNVQVYIPKFTHRKKMDLIPVMKANGVVDIFDPYASKLDLMCKFGAYVSTMLHEAVVIVDEAGTEAAASTVAVVTMKCCFRPEPPKVFNANRSFVYYIKHMATNTILFVGDYHGN